MVAEDNVQSAPTAEPGALNLIVKAHYAGVYRKWVMHNADLTYDELMVTLQRIFQPDLVATDDVVIMYRDDDGDLITVRDTADIHFAIRVYQPPELKLFLTKDVGSSSSSLFSAVATTSGLLRQLRAFRLSVDQLVGAFEAGGNNAPGCQALTVEPAGDGQPSTESGPDKEECAVALAAARHEFDPIASSFGLDAEAASIARSVKTGNSDAGIESAVSTPSAVQASVELPDALPPTAANGVGSVASHDYHVAEHHHQQQQRPAAVGQAAPPPPTVTTAAVANNQPSFGHEQQQQQQQLRSNKSFAANPDHAPPLPSGQTPMRPPAPLAGPPFVPSQHQPQHKPPPQPQQRFQLPPQPPPVAGASAPQRQQQAAFSPAPPVIDYPRTAPTQQQVPYPPLQQQAPPPSHPNYAAPTYQQQPPITASTGPTMPPSRFPPAAATTGAAPPPPPTAVGGGAGLSPVIGGNPYARSATVGRR